MSSSWGWPKDKPRKKGGPYRHKIDLRINDKMKAELKKVEGGEKGRSEWMRELLGDALDTLDPPDQTIPQTLIPFDYLLMASNKLRTNIRDVAKKFVKERPIMKETITRRRGIAYEIFTKMEIIEETSKPGYVSLLSRSDDHN